ncbi:hypothetical protein TNCV_2858521 [Trichonephila clavipes]|nr:hypothetical protein TNCV_2858521 [Trichonephila clavipes]
MNSRLVYHEASTAEAPPCRGEMNVKSIDLIKHPPIGMEVRKGECQLRRLPRHLIMVQNYEVRLYRPLSS